MRVLRTLTAAAMAAAVVMLAPAAASASSSGDAQVSILHGVPEATVDVYANGDAVLEGFEPGTLTDPLTLPAGDYDLKVTEAGAGPDGTALIEANGVAVPGGANITVVAHLDADGNPALTPFVNDVSPTAAGEARLTVRHTAAAPAVDVRANGEVAFSELTNPNEASADLAAGTISADVVLAGTSDVAIGPADVELGEGTHTIVYAWGSAEDGNLDLAVQTISGLHSAPGGVPAGSGGQADDGGVNPLVPAGIVAVLLGGLTFAVLRRSAGAEQR